MYNLKLNLFIFHHLYHGLIFLPSTRPSFPFYPSNTIRFSHFTPQIPFPLPTTAIPSLLICSTTPTKLRSPFSHCFSIPTDSKIGNGLPPIPYPLRALRPLRRLLLRRLGGAFRAGSRRGLVEPCADHGRLPVVRDGREHDGEAGGHVLLRAEDGTEDRRGVPVRDFPEQRAARGLAQHDQGHVSPGCLPRVRSRRHNCAVSSGIGAAPALSPVAASPGSDGAGAPGAAGFGANVGAPSPTPGHSSSSGMTVSVELLAFTSVISTIMAYALF